MLTFFKLFSHPQELLLVTFFIDNIGVFKLTLLYLVLFVRSCLVLFFSKVSHWLLTFGFFFILFYRVLIDAKRGYLLLLVRES